MGAPFNETVMGLQTLGAVARRNLINRDQIGRHPQVMHVVTGHARFSRID